MICPRCYSKIEKNKNRCDYCGFNLNELKDASNKKAKLALKSPYKDDVIYSKQLPKDVDKKRLLIYTILLGLLGVHYFYVGRLWKGIYYAVINSVSVIIASLVIGLNIITNTPLYIASQFAAVFFALNIILWIIDIFDVTLNRFKVPVYKESFSK